MTYTETLTIHLPVALEEVAAQIARALDPDLGGVNSFFRTMDGELIRMKTPCTPEYKSLLMSLKDNPVKLHSLVAADYAARWPNLPAPTLAECQSFCSSVTLLP